MGQLWSSVRKRTARGTGKWLTLWVGVAGLTGTGAGGCFAAATPRSPALYGLGGFLVVVCGLAVVLMFAAALRVWPHSPLDKSDNAELLRAMTDRRALTTDAADRLHAPLIGQVFETTGMVFDVKDDLLTIYADRSRLRIFIFFFDESARPRLSRLQRGQRVKARGTLSEIDRSSVVFKECELLDGSD